MESTPPLISTPVEPYDTSASSSSAAASTSTPATAAATVASQANMPSNLVVHHLNDSRSQRILWLLEELQLPYTIKRYQRTSAGLAPPELLAVHPLGKSPVVTVGTHTLAESGAIVDYIIDRYGSDRLTVTDPEQRLSVSYWSHAAEGSFMPPLTMLHVFRAIREKTPWLVRPVATAITHAVEGSFLNPTVKKLFDFTEQHLQSNRAKGFEYMVGSHLTAADFMILFPLEGAKAGRAGLGSETKQYVDRMQARDAYKRGLQKGGEYAYAKM